LPKHNVVQHADAEYVAHLFEPARDFLIFLTGCWFSARVIVDKDHSGRAKVKRRTPDFTRMN
jgi:hypothetical protein